MTGRKCGLCFGVIGLVAFHASVRADNQTPDFSPVVIGGTLPLSAQIQGPSFASDALPSLQSFSKAQYGGDWLLIGGMTNGRHNLGHDGFNPDYQNQNVIVIDPATGQYWSRSLTDPTSGLTQAQVDTLTVTNAQFDQQGSHLYVAGGYGQGVTTWAYQTYSTLTSIDLPGMINWVKSGQGSAAGNLRQISDPMFQVTGGDMATTANGQTHLVFGQNYPYSYSPAANGIYTQQVRNFTIVDNASGLSVTNVSASTAQDDFRRRDLNVVPIIRMQNGQPVQALQALSGVFTPSFGVWTVPVTIDANGVPTEPDPTAPSTFKQAVNGYRCANVELYSARSNTMHTLLFGGISASYYDASTGQMQTDSNIPFVNDATDIVTDASGHMTQYELPSGFPALTTVDGTPALFGAETEFFLKDGVPTYSNGVIDLDALTGPTLVGYLYGGIVADAPNYGNTEASGELFPLVITPVPEPAVLALAACVLAVTRKRTQRSEG